MGYGALAEAVKRGFAAAGTDTGHAGGSASFALGHPEKLTDFAYRAVHEMTVTSKAIIQNFYGTAPRYSYWNGCSTGGRQGLKEAQKFPADFDGIVAGAPANYQTHLHVWSVWVAQQMNKTPGSFIPPEKLAVLHKAVVAACDANDGVKDGLLNDPTKCHFDPKTIECKGEDLPNCLVPAQVAAVQAIYAGPKSPSGKEIFPTYAPGSELGWGLLGGQQGNPVATDSFTYVVYKNPQWDWRSMNLDERRRRDREVLRQLDRCYRSQPETILRSQRQADSLSRLGRPRPSRPATASTTTKAWSRTWVAKKSRR